MPVVEVVVTVIVGDACVVDGFGGLGLVNDVGCCAFIVAGSCVWSGVWQADGVVVLSVLGYSGDGLVVLIVGRS